MLDWLDLRKNSSPKLAREKRDWNKLIELTASPLAKATLLLRS